MLVVHAADELPPGRERAAAIGNFDGVHIGHRAVLEQTTGLGLTSMVLTFDPHPRAFFGDRVTTLCSLQRRLELLADAGVEEALVQPFTPDLARAEPEEWARRCLRRLNIKVVTVGEQFRFGRRRSGDIPLLRELGFDVRVVPVETGVSSTRVRELVRDGDVESASRILGRPHELDVRLLDLRLSAGRTRLELGIGDATAAVPPPGVYFGRLVPDGRSPLRTTAMVQRADGRIDVTLRGGDLGLSVGDALRVILHRRARDPS